MSARALTLARRGLDLAFLGLIGFALGLLFLGRGLPALGHPVYVIRSGSMAPAVPVGAIVILDPTSRAVVTQGDVVTLRLDDGAIFTHRVTRTVSLSGVPYVETKGDANRSIDPAITPLDHVLGRVVFVVPEAGYLMVAVATPLGLAAMVLAALTLMTALWLLDEEDDHDGRRTRAHSSARVSAAISPDRPDG